MLVGHAGLALAAKAAQPRLNLGLLILAAMAADLLGCVLELAGLDAAEAAGIAHSLSISIAIAAVFFLAALVWVEGKAAALLAFIAFSHWPLDWLVHQPDMPLLWPGGIRVGYGLWRTPDVAVAVELGIAAAGLAAFLLRKSPGRRLFVAALIGLAAVPSVIADYAQQAYHRMTAAESVLLAAVGLALMLTFVIAAGLADRARR